MNLLTLTLALLCAKPSAENTPLEHPVPAWIPRGASIGLFVNSPVVAPHVRIEWDVTFYESRQDAFIGLVELGTGFGLSLPSNIGMKELFQHVALVGVGYRNTGSLFHWGFQFGLGPTWYRASYVPHAPYLFESRVVGYAEGRAQVGLRLAPHLILGVYFGFASPWSFSTQLYPGNNYLGGFDFGFFADWR